MTPRRHWGFTLVEVLASLAVLAIGLSAVVAMVLSSGRISAATANRNIAALVINEAAADIERRHLIADTSHGNTPDQVGLLIETLYSPSNPNTHDGVSFKNIPPRLPPSYMDLYLNQTGFDNDLRPYVNPSPPPDPQNVNTLLWPLLKEDPKYFGGPPRQSSKDTIASSGGAYRVIYRLERHPDWHPHTVDPASGATAYNVENPNSPFLGIYVLTLTVYAERVRLAKRLEQISDPVVLYLRDRKVR